MMNETLSPVPVCTITKGIALMLLLSGSVVMTARAAPPDVPAEVSDLYYRLGGGQYLPPPGAMYSTFNIRSRFKIGLGYSCGKFNFVENLEQMVNTYRTKARQLPGQLEVALSAAITSLPGYFMRRVNPSLYNTITKTLDETAELFRLSYQSCQEIERQMQRNPDANPYANFVQASVAERWTVGADRGDVAADVDQATRDTPAAPIRWLGGDLYGTEANPIQINRDIVVAGYNIMIGRTGDVSVTTRPVGPMALEPIVRIWESPAVAGRWVQEVLGDTKILLDPENKNRPEAIPGKGLRPKVEALELEIDLALTEAIERDDYEDLNTFTSARISAAIIDALRDMPYGEAAVMRDRLVSELAVSEARERMMLIKQMMMTGLRAPDLVASTGGSVAETYIRENSFPDINRVIREIFDALELKQRTVNQTTIAILNRAAQNREATANTAPSSIKDAPSALGGAVKE